MDGGIVSVLLNNAHWQGPKLRLQWRFVLEYSALTINSSIEARRINIEVLKVNIAMPVAVVLPTVPQSLVDWQLEFDKSKVNALENLEKGDPLLDLAFSLALCIII